MLVGLGVAGGGEACQLFAPDLNNVIALEVIIDSTVEQDDTLRARAILHTAGGDTTTADSAGSPVVYWTSFDPETLAVVDSARGIFVGVDSGATSVEAYSGNLRSTMIPIHVRPAADTLAVLGTLDDTISVATGDSVSDSLVLEVADTMTIAPGVDSLVPLFPRVVTFALTPAPLGASTVLVTNDTTHTGVARDTVYTDSSGVAAIQLRYLGGGTLPDSVVVTAQAKRAVGTALAGSPVTFIVHLTP